MRNPSILGVVAFALLTALPAPESHADSHPVVFVKGMGSDPATYDKPELHKLFADSGHPLILTRNKTKGTIATRAAALVEELARVAPASGPFHVIAHSMGGLEMRLAIHQYGLGSRVLSLTTIGTPHHGSPVADLARVRDKYPPGSWQDKGIKALTALFGSDPEGVSNLTSTFMAKEFNPVVKDDPRVRYFSMSHWIQSPAILFTTERNILAAHTAIALGSDVKRDDGLVPADSQKWGEVIVEGHCDHRTETQPGTYRGCNHLKVFKQALDNINRVFP